MSAAKILTTEIARDIQGGIDTIRSPNSTDPEKRDKALAAMFELQLRKAQAIEIGRFKLRGRLAIIGGVIVAILFLWKVDVPSCIRAWRCSTTAAPAAEVAP